MPVAEIQVTEEEKLSFKRMLKRMKTSEAIEMVLEDRGGTISVEELRRISERSEEFVRQHCHELTRHGFAEWREDGKIIALK